MRGPDEQTSHVFNYPSPEQRVRPNHPLRATPRCSMARPAWPRMASDPNCSELFRFRKERRRQLIETNGSSGWIRTSNPPVNSKVQVVGLAGSSCR
jgi:hypothetical protein